VATKKVNSSSRGFPLYVCMYLVVLCMYEYIYAIILHIGLYIKCRRKPIESKYQIYLTNRTAIANLALCRSQTQNTVIRPTELLTVLLREEVFIPLVYHPYPFPSYRAIDSLIFAPVATVCYSFDYLSVCLRCLEAHDKIQS
jgi:hypothetical protein